MERSTRRSALRRGLLLVAGGMGLGAARVGAQASEPGRDPAGAIVPSPIELVLYARDRHSLSPSRGNGEPPEEGDLLTGRAVLFDAPGGERVGELHSASFAVAAGAGPNVVERLEMHTFRLGEGTIIGTGAAAHIGGSDVFAVVGGTGRYAAARGSYEARQSPHELGGDGSAEFIFTLLL